MSEESLPEIAAAGVMIQLMDPNSGRPIQSWSITDKQSVTIGRGDDRDVVVANPYVSRNHAELQNRAGQWVLISLGRNGVLVRDQLIEEYPVEQSVAFRLGKQGPSLRFECKTAEPLATATLESEDEEEFLFFLDQERLNREVSEIADGDFFRDLQAKANSLRDSSSAATKND